MSNTTYDTRAGLWRVLERIADHAGAFLDPRMTADAIVDSITGAIDDSIADARAASAAELEDRLEAVTGTPRSSTGAAA